MRYFSKYVMIKYSCGHKGKGIDTYQAFVTENVVQCRKCGNNLSHPFLGAL